MQKFNIGKEFSSHPQGRFFTDSDSSGERFREEFLKNKIQSLEGNDKIQIIIDDGVDGYGSSFLVEGFAGLVKYGYFKSDDLLKKIDLVCTDPDYLFYKDKIIEYIKQSNFNSQKYESTKK